MQSCIYEGWVRHRRFKPVVNHFRYNLFMMFLDLAELPELFRGRLLWSAEHPAPAWCRRLDYLGEPDVPLDVAVRDCVQADTGRRPLGPIRMLTHLRYFGYCFNPVSLYYCYTAAGDFLDAIVAEITNTPWGERHTYVLPCSGKVSESSPHRFRFGKTFHVSPFMDMGLDYDWQFTDPGQHLTVHMDNLDENVRLFDATLVLQRREITDASLNRVFVRYPLMTLRIITQIHFQALRLWLKRCPFYVHPAKRSAGQEGSSL